MNVDKLASFSAAFAAGKLPSQDQVSLLLGFAQSLVRTADAKTSDVANKTNSSDVGQLSEHGTIISKDLVEILEAFKALGEHKNSMCFH